MPLTDFLRNKEIRQTFVQQFPKPKLKTRNDAIAPPQTKRYGMVGTAFDYLLRFIIEYHNDNVISYKWNAEKSLQIFDITARIEREMGIQIVQHYGGTGDVSFYNAATDRPISLENSKTGSKILSIIHKAKELHSHYLSTGIITDEIISIAINLAQLDSVYRRGQYDETLGIEHVEDIKDLRNLAKLVNPDDFKAQHHSILNPTFGRATTFVGGADADLIIDGTLIEIKTTKKLELSRDHFLQLMGYYSLYRIDGISEVSPTPQIDKIGIYFSRYGELHTFSLSDIVNEATLPQFLHWFQEKAPGIYKR